MKIKIKDKEVELKYMFKPEMYFETAAEKPFKGELTTDWILMFFSYIIATEGDGFIGYEEFIDYLSDNPLELYEFIYWYTEQMTNINDLRVRMLEGKMTGTGTTGALKKAK